MQEIFDTRYVTEMLPLCKQVCDLSSLQQIKDFASRYVASENPLYVLVLIVHLLAFCRYQ